MLLSDVNAMMWSVVIAGKRWLKDNAFSQTNSKLLE